MGVQSSAFPKFYGACVSGQDPVFFFYPPVFFCKCAQHSPLLPSSNEWLLLQLSKRDRQLCVVETMVGGNPAVGSHGHRENWQHIKEYKGHIFFVLFKFQNNFQLREKLRV